MATLSIVVLLAILTSMVAVPIASFVLQRSYARAVVREMRSLSIPAVHDTATRRPVLEPDGTQDPSIISRSTDGLLVPLPDAATLAVRARTAASQAARAYIFGGTIFGTWSAATYAGMFMVQGVLDDPLALVLAIPVTLVFALLLSPVFAWPIVPTLLALRLLRPRMTKVALVSLTIGLAVLITTSAALLPLVWLPAGLISLFMAPAFRGVAWLIAPVTLAAGTLFFGILIIPVVSPPGSRAYLLVGLGIPLVVALVRGWLVVHRYARKQISDDTLMVSQWWFIQLLVLALVPMIFSPWAAASCLLAFLAFSVVVSKRLRTLHSRAVSVAPVRLLILRTFGHRRRSRRLLNGVASAWRWIGSIEVVAADDIATATLEPHEFLDYVRGRLHNKFIGDLEGLDRRLATLDLAPDLDGRYRVNDLFCTDRSWQAALRRLIAESAAILVDLRGFDPTHAGVAYEIEQLVLQSRLDRAVAIVDDTTSLWLVEQTVRRASLRREGYRAWEPEVPQLRLISAGRASGFSSAVLFHELCRCAAQSNRAA